MSPEIKEEAIEWFERFADLLEAVASDAENMQDEELMMHMVTIKVELLEFLEDFVNE